MNADFRLVFDVVADNDGDFPAKKSYRLVCQIQFG